MHENRLAIVFFPEFQVEILDFLSNSSPCSALERMSGLAYALFSIGGRAKERASWVSLLHLRVVEQ
jgi:hypothetical protein